MQGTFINLFSSAFIYLFPRKFHCHSMFQHRCAHGKLFSFIFGCQLKWYYKYFGKVPLEDWCFFLWFYVVHLNKLRCFFLSCIKSRHLFFFCKSVFTCTHAWCRKWDVLENWGAYRKERLPQRHTKCEPAIFVSYISMHQLRSRDWSQCF